MRSGLVISKSLKASLGIALCLGIGLAGCSSPAPKTSGFSYTEEVPHGTPAKAVVASGTATPPVVTTQPVPAAQAEPVSAVAVPTGNRSTSVLLLEQIGASEARIGMPYSYQIRVTNLTNMTVTGIVLDQHLPPNFKLSSSPNPTAVASANPPTTQPTPPAESHTHFEMGDLRPGESKTLQVTGTPTRAGAIDTRLGVQYNPPELFAHVTVVAPQLKIVTRGPTEADICQEIVCHYSVTNVGSGMAHGVALQETLPEGLFTSETESHISASLGDLAPGESKSFTAHLRAVRAGKYATRATIVSADTPQVDADRLVTSVVAPSLAMTITGPRESYFGQPLTLQISVTNRGEGPAGHARLRLGTTPGHARLVNVTTAEGTVLPTIADTNEQDLGVILPGQTRKAMAHFLPQQGGALTADVTALANCAEPVAASASTRIVTVAAPSLTVSHDPDPVASGSNVTYHITVQNKGTAPDENVTVSAILPASAQLVHAGGGTEATSEGSNITFAPIPVLQPGKSVTWQVEAKALRADDAQFVASMKSASLTKPIVRLESTTFFGLQGGTVTGTSDVPTSAPASSPTTAPADQLNK